MLNKQVDYKIFFAIFALIIFGMVMISSVSVYSSYKVTSLLASRGTIDEPYNHFYLLRNISHVIISMITLLFITKIPYNFYEKYSKYIFGGSIFLMLVVLTIGAKLLGSKRWIILPGMPFSIQPSEFLVLGVIIFLAYFFKKYNNKLHDLKQGLLPFLGIIGGVFLLLALQPNFGSIMILGPLTFFMFFIAGAKFKHILSILLIGIIFSFSIYSLGKYDKNDISTRNKLSYATDRIDNFLASKKDLIESKTVNYQLEQGFIAIGSGGLTGLGFGSSIQKFGYLPEVQGDMIFSVVIEELGFIGGLILLSIIGFIGYRGFFISYYSNDLFAKYTSFGITCRILMQSFINIGVNLGVVPLTGITLPFISYGGSSLLSLIIGIGIILNISRYIDENNIKSTNSRVIKKSKVIMYN